MRLQTKCVILVGVMLTGCWIALIAIGIVQGVERGWYVDREISLYEFSGIIASLVGAPTLIWLIVGLLLQYNQLVTSVNALTLQADEFKNNELLKIVGNEPNILPNGYQLDNSTLRFDIKNYGPVGFNVYVTLTLPNIDQQKNFQIIETEETQTVSFDLSSLTQSEVENRNVWQFKIDCGDGRGLRTTREFGWHIDGDWHQIGKIERSIFQSQNSVVTNKS